MFLGWRKEEKSTEVNYASGVEKPSENDNLGGNGETFERSKGIFLSYVLEI